MKCDELKVYFIPIKKNMMGLSIVKQSYYLKSEVDAAIAELKAKLESEKASHYADSVDAGIRERRLNRALWLQRVETAKTEIRYWRERLFNEPATTRACIHGQRLIPHNPFRTIREWLSIWEEVERKCRTKAEEFGG